MAAIKIQFLCILSRNCSDASTQTFSKHQKTDGNEFKMFYEKECNILINPHWFSDTGHIFLETCQSNKQTRATHSFVYRNCDSLGKYFLYLKVNVDWCLFTATSLQIFWQNVYRNVPWVVVYKTYLFCCTLLIWLVTMATKRQTLRNIYIYIYIYIYNSSEAVLVDKAEFCRIVSNHSLYKNIVFITVAQAFWLLWQLKKFPFSYNGNRENWYLLLSHCRYFAKSFAEMFVE